MKLDNKPLRLAKAPPRPTTETVEVDAKNAALLRRLDVNDDGVIEPAEAKEALTKAAVYKIRRDLAAVPATDRERLAKLEDTRVALRYAGQPVGEGEGRITWNAVREDLFIKAADQPAPLGTIGQGRPDAIRNKDCGPAAALFMHDLRVKRGGADAPVRTHREADAIIDDVWGNTGSTGPQIAHVMDRAFSRSGPDEYRHRSQAVTLATFGDEVKKGLDADAGGVMIPTVSTYDDTRTRGTPHWLVVIGVEDDVATFYDPGGYDGANHLSTAPLEELAGRMPEPTGFIGNQIVFGEKVENAQRKGELNPGTPIGELEVFGPNETIRVRAPRGVFADRTEAQSHARAVAGDDDDAIVRREGDLYAVYAIDEVGDRFGTTRLSDNTLQAMDVNVTDTFFTDPKTGEVSSR